MLDWKKRIPRYKNLKSFSIRDKLRSEKRSSAAFEVMLGNLSLEEMLSLRLELASRLFNNKLYGIPLWHSLTNVVKDAIIKYAYSAGNNITEIARFLGLSKAQYRKLVWKYQPTNYFTGEKFIFKTSEEK